jgi:NTP pyrophosphatase (non-canonical NTP hydrolase)
MSIQSDGLASLFLELNELAGYVHAMAIDKGWYDQPRNRLELLCLIHSEISEACEAIRHDNPSDEHCPEFSSAEIELADAIIRILDMAAYLKWDIEGALRAKIEYNATRSHRHGGKTY